MSEPLKLKMTKVNEQFKDFTNFIELQDFRSFLLFTLTSQIPNNILAQIGLGGSRDVINLPYNPNFNIYYQKINLFTSTSLIIYVKSDPIKDDLLIERDNPVFKKYLNANEMSLAFRGKEKILLPHVSDCSTFYTEKQAESSIIQIDDLFHSLESFMAILEPNIVFVLHANDPEPDLLFTFNMMPEFPGKLKKSVLKIDVYLDNDHRTNNITYIKREEDYKLVLMEDIKEVSHADLYKSAFSLIIHVKSLNKPY
ncbi:MAG: hypothetical protein EU539_11195 [Promethearchaeota archaeon]|nr:MAG: hypothetical protein EU539_11195 [Candidatus Lokiarchaeota archaeon]